MVEDGGSAPLVASGLFWRRRVYNPLAGTSSGEKLVRPAGIAPASPDWHTGILLLNDGRIKKERHPDDGQAARPGGGMCKKEQTPLPHLSVPHPLVFTADVSVFEAHLPESLYGYVKEKLIQTGGSKTT